MRKSFAGFLRAGGRKRGKCTSGAGSEETLSLKFSKVAAQTREPGALDTNEVITQQPGASTVPDSRRNHSAPCIQRSLKPSEEREMIGEWFQVKIGQTGRGGLAPVSGN